METYVIESPVEDYIIADVESSDDLWNRVMLDIESVSVPFRQKAEIRNRNLAFKKGDQWSLEELESFEMQYRPPYVFNEIQAKVNHLVGTQTKTRLDARAVGREKGDQAGAEMLSFLLKWAEQVNDLEFTETATFEESLYGGVACTVVRWEMEELEFGYPAVEAIPMNEMYWDINSRRMDLKDARWQSRVCTRTRLEAIEQYPKYKDIIKNANPADGSYLYTRFNQALSDRQQKIQEAASRRQDGKDGRDLVQIIEYYEKYKRYKYIVNDEIQGVQNEFEEIEEARAFYQGVEDGYIKQGQQLINPDATPRIQLLATTSDLIQQTVIIGDQVLYTMPMKYPYFPYVLNWGYFNEGDYWGFVDDLIWPQICVNRYFTQQDYQLGTGNKGLTTVVASLLQKGFGIEQLRQEKSKTSPLVPVLQHNALQEHPNSPINPELFNGINMSIMRMNDYAGGKNVLGQQENAAESGRAVIARAEMGGVGRLPLFDHLRFWRKQVSERLIWLMKNFMPTGQVLRIIGTNGDVEFVEVDDQLVNTLMEIKYDIVIDEVTKTETVREAQFQALKEYASVTQMPWEVIAPFLLELSPIQERMKREILDGLELSKAMKEQQAQQQKQQKLTQEVQDSLFKAMLRKQADQGEEIKAQEAEAQRKEKKLKTKLDDIEEAKQEMAQGKTSPVETNQMFDKLQTPEELSRVQQLQV